jgi:hypothetical protein
MGLRHPVTLTATAHKGADQVIFKLNIRSDHHAAIVAVHRVGCVDVKLFLSSGRVMEGGLALAACQRVATAVSERRPGRPDELRP